MARKFKLGDTVEVIPGAQDIPGYFQIGNRGKITRYVSGELFPYVVKRRNGNECRFSTKELKLIKKGK